MTNRFLNATEYANVFLLLLKNELALGRLVDGQYRDMVTDQNGLVINVKRPPRFVAQTGAALATQDVVTGSETVRVDQYRNVHVSVGDLEYVQSYNELMRNATMQSAASELAHTIDQFIATQAQRFFSVVGSGATGQTGNSFNGGPTTPAEFTPAHTRLMDQACPNDGSINSVLTFLDGANIRGALTGGFIQGVNRNALERTQIPVQSEINIYASNNLPSYTTGTRTNGTVNGAGQNVNYRDVATTAQVRQNFNITGLGAGGTVRAGEVFTIAGVNAVNPRTRQSLGRLQQFVVLADATADSAGAATVAISPAIIVGGTNDGFGTLTNTAFATVTAAPANAAVVTFRGTASAAEVPRFAMHRRAIALVSARLETPFTGEAAFAQDPETGVSIRYWRGSDIATGAHVHRWDAIYGASVMDNYLGTRITGSST